MLPFADGNHRPSPNAWLADTMRCDGRPDNAIVLALKAMVALYSTGHGAQGAEVSFTGTVRTLVAPSISQTPKGRAATKTLAGLTAIRVCGPAH